MLRYPDKIRKKTNPLQRRKRRYRIIREPGYGYRRLDPIPAIEEVDRFYRDCYYDLIVKGGRAPEIRRLMLGGNEAKREQEWLAATLYSDISFLLKKYSGGKQVIDIGCGTGDLISFLKDKGFEVCGIEVALKAAELASSRGLKVYNSVFEEFVKCNQHKYDSALLMNVLEHVPDPLSMVSLAKKAIKRGGLICIWVPNDFNELQLAAREQLKSDERWVTAPDHINYFDFKSLHRLLSRFGFEIVHSQGSFPMELFLLMGEDYVKNRNTGTLCHHKRVKFEMAIPGEMRRRIYAALAGAGLGRDCLVCGRLKR